MLLLAILLEHLVFVSGSPAGAAVYDEELRARSNAVLEYVGLPYDAAPP